MKLHIIYANPLETSITYLFEDSMSVLCIYKPFFIKRTLIEWQNARNLALNKN